jgi:predicted RNase H-like HicB family nuclease
VGVVLADPPGGGDRLGAGAERRAPDLSGVIAAAESHDECVALMREAIEFHLAGMREDGLPVPPPETVAAEVITLDAA